MTERCGAGGARWVVAPATLRASLVARLDRLSSVWELVQAGGGVLVREFAHDLPSAVSGVPEPSLLEALDRLAEADLVQRAAGRGLRIPARAHPGRRPRHALARAPARPPPPGRPGRQAAAPGGCRA